MFTTQSLVATCYEQWFVGPFFTPSGRLTEYEHPVIEISVLGSNVYGFYNDQSQIEDVENVTEIRTPLLLLFGLTERIGLEMLTGLSINSNERLTFTHFRDSVVRLGYQVTFEEENSWVPDSRILVHGVLPTGNIHCINPEEVRVRTTGQGVWQMAVHAVMQKRFFIHTCHPMRFRVGGGYYWPFENRIEAGSIHSALEGHLELGNYFATYFSGEYAFSRTWAFALEGYYLHARSGKFVETHGIARHLPLYRELILAPEIQHTVSENDGFVIGNISTVYGRNITAYTTFFLQYHHTF